MDHEEQDPLGYNARLPLSACYYPLGFPLIVETNSEAILTLASSLWSRWPARQGIAPARFRIAVADCDSRVPLTASMPRGQQHLVSIIHAPDNFAMCDLRASFAFAAVTRDVAANADYVQYHFLEPLAYLMIDAAHLAPMHASCVAWNGNAIVLCGDSGAGKTSLAYACARRGWTYLSDDATHIIRGRSQPWVAGRPFRIRFRESARELFPELRAFVPRQRPNGKLDIEVETEALNLIVSPNSRASHIVFLDRTGSTAAALLNSYPAKQAAGRLQGLVCYGDEHIRREQKRALGAFLQLPVAKLTYNDTASAEKVLRNLVEAASPLS
jgi:hypothetical protein